MLVLGLAGAALGETYSVTPYPGHSVAVGTNGDHAHGIVAVSDSGSATGDCLFDAGGFLGCLAGPALAVSGTGTANGGMAVSGTGTATAQGMGWSTDGVAVSGTGCATGGHPAGSSDSVVVSGTGCATGTTHPTYGGHPLTVSGTGESRGSTAVSGTVNAYGGPARTWPVLLGPSVDSPGAAVSGTGNAHGGAVTVGGAGAYSSGGVVAVSPAGEADGALVNIGFR